MKKLKLEIEALAVESFATATSPGEAGTVRGRAELAGAGAYDVPRNTPGAECDVIIVPYTQAPSCPYTCAGDTCPGTCVTDCSCITTPCTTCV
jgi:hypothetical protein